MKRIARDILRMIILAMIILLLVRTWRCTEPRLHHMGVSPVPQTSPTLRGFSATTSRNGDLVTARSKSFTFKFPLQKKELIGVQGVHRPFLVFGFVEKDGMDTITCSGGMYQAFVYDNVGAVDFFYQEPSKACSDSLGTQFFQESHIKKGINKVQEVGP